MLYYWMSFWILWGKGLLVPLYKLKALTTLRVDNRFKVASIADGELSIPIHLLPSSSAETRVVPEPEKQSNTISSALEEALMITLSISAFFSVG